MTVRRLALLALLAPALFAAAAGAAPPDVDGASVALHAGNASNAVALATQALADATLTPRDRARVLVDRGLAHEMLGEHDAALLDFTEAINARALPNPDQARALYDRGVALDALGQTDDAIGDYSAAIRLDPRHAAALNNRGNAYRRAGRLDDAAADYRRSLSVGNAHPEYSNYGLGLIAEAQGNPALARSYYQAAISTNPQFTLAVERITALSVAPVAATAPPVPASLPPKPASQAFVSVPPASADTAPVVLRPPGSAPAPSTTAASVTPLQPYVPADSDGPIILRPPGSAVPAPAEDGTIHLRPPSERVHLHPPRPVQPKPPHTASAPAPAPDLKPAFGDSTRARTIQLGAWRNEADAAEAWNRIVGVAGTLVAGLSPQVVPVTLPGKGQYYRLRAGPVYDDVNQLCAALHARKLECFVVN